MHRPAPAIASAAGAGLGRVEAQLPPDSGGPDVRNTLRCASRTCSDGCRVSLGATALTFIGLANPLQAQAADGSAAACVRPEQATADAADAPAAATTASTTAASPPPSSARSSAKTDRILDRRPTPEEADHGLPRSIPVYVHVITDTSGYRHHPRLADHGADRRAQRGPTPAARAAGGGRHRLQLHAGRHRHVREQHQMVQRWWSERDASLADPARWRERAEHLDAELRVPRHRHVPLGLLLRSR